MTMRVVAKAVSQQGKRDVGVHSRVRAWFCVRLAPYAFSQIHERGDNLDEISLSSMLSRDQEIAGGIHLICITFH